VFKQINLKIILTLFTSFYFSGCAGLLENRTFVDEMDHQTDPLFVAGQDFEHVSGDEGVPYRSREEVTMRTPASAMESYQRDEVESIYRELAFRERKLNPRDRELYNEVQTYLETPSEKIYFLSLSPYEREEYLKARRIDIGPLGASRSYNGSRSMASLAPVYNQALNLGMSKDDVLRKWGRPARVEVAGNPAHQNERWSFFENGQVRQIYFEGGAVQGWNIQ